MPVTNGNVNIADGANVTCTVNNRYARGKFQITKTVTGPAGGFTGTNSTPFTGTYTCTGGIGPVAFSVTQGTPYLSPEYPAGTTCTVTETQPTGHLADSSWSWNAPSYTPANKQATIVDGQVPTVAIANTFAQDTGSLKVTKRVDARPGAAVSDYTGGPSRTFPITYTCKIGATTVKTGTDRVQPVDATPACWSNSRCSLNASAGVLHPSVLRGLVFSACATASMSSADQRDRSVPLGKYWRSRPLVFSLVPRCQGDCGSAKKTGMPVSTLNLA